MAAEEEKQKNEFETRIGIALAIVAGIVAVSELAASKIDGEATSAVHERSNVYSWYQAKTVKESLANGQRDSLQTALVSASIKDEHRASVADMITKLGSKITRYEKEQEELLKGSATVGEKNWAQDDRDGKLGQIIGAHEWDNRLAVLNRAGNAFDIATVFLQLSLVLGAAALLLKSTGMKTRYFYGMLGSASLGFLASLAAGIIGFFG